MAECFFCGSSLTPEKDGAGAKKEQEIQNAEEKEKRARKTWYEQYRPRALTFGSFLITILITIATFLITFTIAAAIFGVIGARVFVIIIMAGGISALVAASIFLRQGEKYKKVLAEAKAKFFKERPEEFESVFGLEARLFRQAHHGYPSSFEEEK